MIVRMFEDIAATHVAERGNVSSKDRREAIAFLTDEGGPMAHSRQDWCDLIGLDARKVRRAALRILRQGTTKKELHRLMDAPA
ncbi:hypothetical protein [Tanticharoenia sakaeratensis]|uniref:Uncharacterized protein n=1 Tax=Tanticharoenia sakaeratensis NBRC 103193 TaxID=1231623 RepID=A0A0D6MNI7_9PROT|nr:hypothetical protein [Tanticharoenia sakaeratensis]GAN55242.1 hypothetical protein Tasa_041_037 [Tanticharoenia sakaeratensis NBRC 103193]